ncbi:UNVERIFIED_CONTAM: hypothetical protein Scaly_3050700 [Sesamum calycinum]|uniref:Reverse transcriptase Ty1/copia-type domain-containing protein n=1 Tax=Sesamum calycinum TaxID=2727403 RepID=A0AAW2K124_9LAMI
MCYETDLISGTPPATLMESKNMSIKVVGRAHEIGSSNNTSSKSSRAEVEVGLDNDLGEASIILRIKIFRDRSKRILGITQNSYAEKVLKRFKIEHSKRGFLPMRHGVKVSKKQSLKTDEELKRMSDIPYASASDDDDAKSQLGTTTDSTMEAEYIAASKAAKEAV